MAFWKEACFLLLPLSPAVFVLLSFRPHCVQASVADSTVGQVDRKKKKTKLIFDRSLECLEALCRRHTSQNSVSSFFYFILNSLRAGTVEKPFISQDFELKTTFHPHGHASDQVLQQVSVGGGISIGPPLLQQTCTGGRGLLVVLILYQVLSVSRGQ